MYIYMYIYTQIYAHTNICLSVYTYMHTHRNVKNDRMGKTRDILKKIRDIKGTFYANLGTIKDRNCMDLTEEEDTKKRWQKYTELYKKRFSWTRKSWWCDHSPRARHPGVRSQVSLQNITKNKDSGGDRIPVELFHILKDDAVKVPYSICQKIWKTQQ